MSAAAADDDYDSDADSDYDPNKDADALEAAQEDEEEDRGLCRITTKRKFEIESVFDAMRDEEEEALRKKMSLAFGAVRAAMQEGGSSAPALAAVKAKAKGKGKGEGKGKGASAEAFPPAPQRTAPSKLQEKRAKRMRQRRSDVLQALTCVFGSVAASSLMSLTAPHLAPTTSNDTAHTQPQTHAPALRSVEHQRDGPRSSSQGREAPGSGRVT